MAGRVGKNRGEVYPYSSPEVPMAAPRRKRFKWRPWLIPLIVVANIVVFVVTMYRNDCPHNTPGQCLPSWLGRFSFQRWKSNPLLGPTGATLRLMGGLEWSAVVERHQGWRLVSCTWLHAGVIHLLANMLGLVFIAIRLEQEFGFIKVGLIYLMSGFAGSVLSALFNRFMISVGASGALFGILGAILAELITNWSIYSGRCAALITLVLIVVINLVLGLMPHVDNFAHLGGFAAGFLLGFVLLMRPQWGWVKKRDLPFGTGPVVPKHKPYQYVLRFLAFVTLVVAYTGALIALFKGVDGNQRCSWCHYLSCVPTSHWSCNR